MRRQRLRVGRRRAKKRRRSEEAQTAFEREVALARLGAFVELVWKDQDGQPVIPGEIHRKIYEALDRAYEAKIPLLILAPRGHGKTEILNACVARLFARKPTLRIQIVSDNDEHARDRVGAVLHYIEKDQDYRRLFPEIALDKSKRGRRTLFKFRLRQNRYAKDPSLEGAGIFSSGTGSRADVQAYDDLCTEKNTLLEPMSRERVKRVFRKTWLNILSAQGWWFYIGTVYHEDDLTHALLKNKRVAHLKIGLSEDFSSFDVEEFWPGDEAPKEYTLPLWTAEWPEERYRDRYELMLEEGDASAFLASYRNLVIDPETADFKAEWFFVPEALQAVLAKHSSDPKYYKHRVLYADPATARKKENCFYAGVVLGWDPDLKKAVVLHAWRAKERLSERVDRFISAVEEWEPHECVVEGQHDESFAERIEERAVERAVGFRLRRHTHGQEDKEARIKGIAPLVQAGKIVADPVKFPWFRNEARVFPNGKMDGLDALEGGWRFMQRWLRGRTAVPRRLHLRAQAPDARMAARYHFNGPAPKTAPAAPAPVLQPRPLMPPEALFR